MRITFRAPELRDDSTAQTEARDGSVADSSSLHRRHLFLSSDAPGPRGRWFFHEGLKAASGFLDSEQRTDAECGSGGEGECWNELIEVVESPSLDDEPPREGQNSGREDGSDVTDLECPGQPFYRKVKVGARHKYRHDWSPV